MRTTKKNLKIALFSLLTIFCLTLVCSATEFSYSVIYDSPDETFEYETLCNYDSITIPYVDNDFNLQLVQFVDLSNVYIYCSNIESYCSFVSDIPQGSDMEQFNELIWKKLIFLNSEAEYMNDIWYTRSILANLYFNGLDFLDDSDSFNEGYESGYTVGYGKGYTEGTYNGMQETESLKTALLTIFSSPLYVFGGILDFEIFGLNLFNLISTLLTIMLFAFVVKHLLL